MIPDENRAVARRQLARRHQRQTASQQGGIVTKEMLIHLSNIALVDANGKATRVGFKMVGDAGPLRQADGRYHRWLRHSTCRG